MALLRIIDKIHFMTKNIERNTEKLDHTEKLGPTDITLDKLDTDYLTDVIYYILSDSEDIDEIYYYIKEICDFRIMYKPNSPNGDARLLALIHKKIEDLFNFTNIC